jgi:hypothetical protein
VNDAIERRSATATIEPSATASSELVVDALFGTRDPQEIVERSVHVADVLMRVVQDRGLAFRFNDRDWYGLGCYQTLAAFFSVTTEPDWVRPLIDGSGWEARFIVRAPDGRVLGAGEGMVSREERNWKTSTEHSIRAMSQVRAQRRALQSVLGFVVQLAGYEISDPGAAATRRQVTALHTRATELGWNDEERHQYAGVESFNDLTRAEAGKLLDAWAVDTGAQTSRSPGHSAADAGSQPSGSREPVYSSESSDPSGLSASLDEAWSRAIEIYGSRVAVLQEHLRRWPSDRGVQASSVTLVELIELIDGAT